MNTETMNAYRETATKTLAIVGFVSLLGLGVWGAVYSARFVPGTVGAAAVYLGSIFNPAPEANLSVVPTASSTVISFGTPTTTGATTTPAKATSTPVKTTPTRHPTQPTQTVIKVSTPTTPAPLTGLPDLTVKIAAIGYLANDSQNTFVASSSVPVGLRPAVRFTVFNKGTNITGAWNFSAAIPTRSATSYKSPMQQSLLPGDSIDYTLGFDQARSGKDQPIEIKVNYDSYVAESNTTNNTASISLNVL